MSTHTEARPIGERSHSFRSTVTRPARPEVATGRTGRDDRPWGHFPGIRRHLMPLSRVAGMLLAGILSAPCGVCSEPHDREHTAANSQPSHREQTVSAPCGVCSEPDRFEQTVSAAATKPNIIVIYTDDHGYADLGLHGIVNDLRTPHVDALARSGVVARHGYSTAPQCVPSRGGLMVGKFQGRFGLDSNGSSLEGFNRETTIATRLQRAGYVTAQFGKWHLGPTPAITQHGFAHVFSQNAQRPFSANITLAGQDRPMGDLEAREYHIDGCSQAAAALIERYHDKPFFLYIAYRAPHVPLDAPPKYLERFPGEMPERRRQALAMLAAVDDGVGLITDTLRQHGLSQQTLIFYIGDNGAPLKIHKADEPGGGPGWDGSLNDPLNGEKGMLAEGGMHVPFVVSWPGTILEGQVFEHPITALDVAATAAAIAQVGVGADEFDGVNILPHLTGEVDTPPHETLYWRWSAQSAIREGRWKLLRGGPREYLYDLDADIEEQHNLAAMHPEVANRLREKLTRWSDTLDPPGLALGPMAQTWNDYFDHYLDGRRIANPSGTESASGKGTPSTPGSAPEASAADRGGWFSRNGKLTAKESVLEFSPDRGGKSGRAFLTRSQIHLAGPATARLTIATSRAGQVTMSWRAEGDRDFPAANRVSMDVTASAEWQTHEIDLPATGAIIHLRLQLPDGVTRIKQIDLTDATGKPALTIDTKPPATP